MWFSNQNAYARMDCNSKMCAMPMHSNGEGKHRNSAAKSTTQTLTCSFYAIIEFLAIFLGLVRVSSRYRSVPSYVNYKLLWCIVSYPKAHVCTPKRRSKYRNFAVTHILTIPFYAFIEVSSHSSKLSHVELVIYA